jgi:long-chain acyl-CoA synthetase
MMNLGELAIKTAIRDPGAPALIEPHLGIRRTFGELSERVELLAHLLQDHLGAGHGARIAAFTKNSLECMELYLACALTGTLLFPMNWRQSTSQNSLALQDADPSVVFYDAEFAAEAGALRSAVEQAIWIEWKPGADSEFEDLLRRMAATRGAFAPLPPPSSLLYDPYLAVSTGGTTGIPKCAVHSQFSYGATMINYMAAQRIDENDVFMMLGQFFHVTGYMPIAHLGMGRPVVITNFDADVTVDVIRQENVTGFFCIATMLPRLVASLMSSGLRTPSVRLAGYGGAPMGETVIRNAAELLKTDLMQIWGMSEFGTGTVLGPAAHNRAIRNEHVELLGSCGRAAVLSTIIVRDERGRPVPQDGRTIGELCHYGPNTMLGYWHKEQETSDLVRDGWVHSGDGATWDAEGNVYIVDRLKNMIISGGENIFPAEIEKLLANMPGVAEAAVVGAPDPEWGEIVRAIVVCSPGASIKRDAVISAVESELGSYRKPRIVDFVDALPMTPTGKVDLKELRALPVTDDVVRMPQA